MAASRPTFVLILIMSLLALLTLSSRSSPSWKTSLRALDVPYYRAFSQTTLKLNKNDYFSLPSGDKIPVIALGTWKANPGEVGRAVSTALKAGYRHIDGAWAYRNEAEVGEAIKASGIAREDIWLTSKLWNSFHAPEDVEAALDETLTALGTPYLDLYLIHWPVAFKKGSNNVLDEALTADPFPTWKKLEEMVEKGKVRNIGVSNFNIRRLQNLTSNPDIKIKPSINQVELSYLNPQPALLEFAHKHGIILEAYSPLGSDGSVKEILSVKEVVEVAKELNEGKSEGEKVTEAQVWISWLKQRGVIVLPKSVTPSRIEQNLKVFEIPQHLFEKLEKAANSHPPRRVVDPSKSWGLDIFEE